MIQLQTGLATMAATDWTRLGALAQAITAGVAALALLGAVAQLAQNRRHERARIAHRYLERYGAPEEIELVAKFGEFIKQDGAARGAALAKWNAMSFEETLEILHGLNFWEELAGMYERRLIDRKIVRDYFGEPALAYWRASEWFIQDQREKSSDDRLMQQFEEMCDHIIGSRKAAAQRRTFPYLWRWRGAGKAERLARSRQERASVYDWVRRLAEADPAEQRRMLAELRDEAGRTGP